MHSTAEQLREIMRRKDIISEKRIIRRHLYASAIASCICAVLLVAVCFLIPRISPVSDTPVMLRYGSLLLATPYLGYVVVGIVAFLLGICITLLCIHWKALKQKEQKQR